MIMYSSINLFHGWMVYHNKHIMNVWTGGAIWSVEGNENIPQQHEAGNLQWQNNIVLKLLLTNS